MAKAASVYGGEREGLGGALQESYYHIRDWGEILRTVTVKLRKMEWLSDRGQEVSGA